MAASIAESRLEAYLREKEERELKECTFHPKILTKSTPRRIQREKRLKIDLETRERESG